MAPPDDGTPFQRTGGATPGIGLIDAAAPIREQLDSAEKATLQAELVEARISARAAADLADYATDEAADLRRRLDAAEQRAGDEWSRADGVEQQLTNVETELVTARAEAAGLRCQLEKARPKPPKSDPPRTRWQRLLRALGHTR
jgi:thioesterase domain-containing protein